MKLLSICILFLSFGLTVNAKDLASRMGVGFSNQFSENLESVVVRYYPSQEMGFSVALGVDTKENESKFGVNGKMYRIIFMEDNLNFYMGGGAGLISSESGGVNKSGFELTGFAGAEFFFSGLDSLGFSFEVGVGVSSLSDQVRFFTFGQSFAKAGIIFYL